MDDMAVAVAGIIMIFIGAAGYRLVGSLVVQINRAKRDIDWEARADELIQALGPPIDWEQFEDRIAAHLSQNAWQPISDDMKRKSWEACEDWTGYSAPAQEKIVAQLKSGQTITLPSDPVEEHLACRRCHEPMGKDAHEPGDTHGATFWIDYPHHRLPGGELRHCRGMLVLEPGPAPIASPTCAQCSKPMYGASGEICGVCVQLNTGVLETLRRHKVPEKALSELSWERLHEVANYLNNTSLTQRSPAWFADDNIELIESAVRGGLLSVNEARQRLPSPDYGL